MSQWKLRSRGKPCTLLRSLLLFGTVVMTSSLHAQPEGKGFNLVETSPRQGTAEDVAAGKVLYSKACDQCHGPEGDGLGIMADLLFPRPRDFRRGVYKVRTTNSGELPTDPDEQNRVWYRLYRQHKDEAPINDAHGSYLLARELACLSIAFLLALPTLALALGVSFKVALPYAGILLILYALVAYSGSYYGRRFVANVLAIESALPEITNES